ncbi:hypothetical protein [Haloprofundus halophilus]|uniref:hypothetical protein n=1 Tax=Haloprofundus halophilus TaxID=2283527 RepID=UPI000E44B872|nr:hypothetical protein [Haloprofundus halophilus]
MVASELSLTLVSAVGVVSAVAAVLVRRVGYPPEYETKAKEVQAGRLSGGSAELRPLTELSSFVARRGTEPDRNTARAADAGVSLARALEDPDRLDGLSSELSFLHEPTEAHERCVANRKKAVLLFLAAVMGNAGVAYGLVYAEQTMFLALAETALFSVSVLAFGGALWRTAQLLAGRRELDRMA